MKNFISILILMVAFLTSSTGSEAGTSTLASNETILAASSTSSEAMAETKASVAGDVQIAFEQIDDGTGETGNFFLRNWGVLTVSLLAFFDVVARLTPSTKDNSIVNLLVTIVNAIIPNFKKGGGTF